MNALSPITNENPTQMAQRLFSEHIARRGIKVRTALDAEWLASLRLLLLTAPPSLLPYTASAANVYSSLIEALPYLLDTAEAGLLAPVLANALFDFDATWEAYLDKEGMNADSIDEWNAFIDARNVARAALTVFRAKFSPTPR